MLPNIDPRIPGIEQGVKIVADIKANNRKVTSRRKAKAADNRRDMIERSAFNLVKRAGNAKRTSFSFAGLEMPWKK